LGHTVGKWRSTLLKVHFFQLLRNTSTLETLIKCTLGRTTLQPKVYFLLPARANRFWN